MRTVELVVVEPEVWIKVQTLPPLVLAFHVEWLYRHGGWHEAETIQRLRHKMGRL